MIDLICKATIVVFGIVIIAAEIVDWVKCEKNRKRRSVEMNSMQGNWGFSELAAAFNKSSIAATAFRETWLRSCDRNKYNRIRYLAYKHRKHRVRKKNLKRLNKMLTDRRQ